MADNDGTNDIKQILRDPVLEKELQKKLITSVHRFKKEKTELILFNLSQSEFFMLQIIKHSKKNEKPGIFVSEIAKKIKVSTPAVSRMLGGLEERQLISRQIDREDRRNTLVIIAPQGEKVLKESEATMDEFTGRVISRMGYEKVTELLELFNTFVDVMEIELKKN